jgi:hypothetical protein
LLVQTKVRVREMILQVPGAIRDGTKDRLVADDFTDLPLQSLDSIFSLGAHTAAYAIPIPQVDPWHLRV